MSVTQYNYSTHNSTKTHFENTTTFHSLTLPVQDYIINTAIQQQSTNLHFISSNLHKTSHSCNTLITATLHSPILLSLHLGTRPPKTTHTGHDSTPQYFNNSLLSLFTSMQKFPVIPQAEKNNMPQHCTISHSYLLHTHTHTLNTVSAQQQSMDLLSDLFQLV